MSSSPRGGSATGALRDQTVDHMAMNIGKPSFNAVVVPSQTRVVDSEQMEAGRVEIVGRTTVLDRLPVTPDTMDTRV